MRDGSRAAQRDATQRRRVPSAVLIGAAVLVAGAFAAALLVLPIRAWVNQRSAIETGSRELAELDDANAVLQADVDRLRTREGIQQAAREELGVVEPKERAYRVLDLPDLGASLPAGWLYPTIQTLMTERVATLGGPVERSDAGETLLVPTTAPTTIASANP